MSPVKILRAAREKISDSARWTRESYARDKNGISVEADSTEAVCWCALGAIWSIVGENDRSGHLAKDELYRAVKIMSGDGVAAINDDCGHEAVLTLYDIAIAAAEGQS